METKILKAVFGGGTSTVTNKRTRTDYGQVLEIIGIDLPDTFECIFSNSATSAGVGKKMIGSAQRVLIPDEYLATGQTIYAWILLHDTEDDGRHMYSIRIPVADMPDTSPEEPTPVEQSVISQAITALNSAVDTTTQKAQEATESADRAEQAAESVEGYAERAESAQQAAESARDRATQAETSARTSAATATEKASEAISSATTASQSAMTAENASESAQDSAEASYQNAQTAYRYAQDSATSARQADGYASDASEYASNANTSAQTASQKAQEAAQSASTTVQAKTDAETAKAASETAQGLAESARDGAVSAKTGAESARDEAQEIVDGITGKVEQIDSNTDRIESLEDDRYKSYAVDTASGAVASFSDGADGIPLKSLVVDIEPVQEGSGDPSPDNVRPISGWTGCEVQRTGKNLLNPAGYDATEHYVINSDGTITVNKSDAGVWTNKPVIPLKAGTYTVSYSATSGSLRYKLSEDNYTEEYITSTSKRFTLTADGGIKFKFGLGASAYPITVKAQLELGNTATDFAPYTGQIYPITFPSEAGTIYGGYIDPINGELVVDRAMVDLGTLDWSYESRYDIFTVRYRGAKTRGGCVCSQYAYSFGLPVLDMSCCIGGVGWFNGFIVVKDSRYTDAATFKTAMSGVQLCYELAEPIHYPITAIDIKTLLGQNNIWADTGDVSVTYRADTTLYISRLTEPDADMIADANITSGSYFMVGNNLYRATANIASGASVIVGTNATKVSLAQALNEINA